MSLQWFTSVLCPGGVCETSTCDVDILVDMHDMQCGNLGGYARHPNVDTPFHTSESPPRPVVPRITLDRL